MAALSRNHGSSTILGTATARMISSINVLTAWRVRSVRFICQRNQRRPSFSKPKPTCCGCARTFRWLTRNSLRWRMDSLPTKSCCQSWPTYRRRQDRLPGNSTEDSSCNCGEVNSRHDPTIDSAPCRKLTHWALILKLVRLLAGIQQWCYYSWHLTPASPREDDLARQDSLLSPNTT
jgi:hypothetical protein